MRFPIVLALIVIITLPKDVQGFAHDVTAQFQVATASVGHLFDRGEKGETLKVAEANVLKTSHDTTKGIVGNIR